MPTGAPIVSKGFKVTFNSVALQLLMDTNPADMSNDVIDSTHQESGNSREKIANGFNDNGDLTLTIQVDPDAIPAIGTKAALEIDWPMGGNSTTATKWAAQGVWSGFTPAGPIGEMVTGDVTIAISGDITVTPGT